MKIKKLFLLGAVLILCLGIFIACVDYGYEFQFSVVGENGTISTDSAESSPVCLLGNKNGQQLELTAIPDSGYRVKEWTLNGEIVEGNTSNSFTAIAINYKQSLTIVTVEFEPIP